jgi:hypothetical protein
MTFAAIRSLPREGLHQPVWVPVAVVWALFVAIVVAKTLPTLVASGPSDPDAAMRLAQVRDLLASQSWSDVVQWRLGGREGVAMHWSRLVDAPIAALIAILSRVTDAASAEVVALTVWPSLLALVYFGAVVAAAVRLAGPESAWPAALCALVAVHVRALFAAGNIDHHNVQLVLALVTLSALVRLDRGAAMGITAGLAAAVMLAVGLETLPLIAGAGLACAVAVIADPHRHSRGAFGFGVSFALASLGLYGSAVPEIRPTTLVCDFLSAPYVAVALTGGLGIACLAATGDRFGRLARTATVVGIGFACLAAVLAIAPQCLRGPYAELSVELTLRWLDTVDEAQTLVRVAMQDSGRVLSLVGAPIVAAAIAILALWRAAPPDRFAWGVVLGAATLTLAVSFIQLRGAAFAAAFAIPAAAWLIVRARAALGPAPAFRAQLALVAAWVLPQSLLYDGLARLMPQPAAADASLIGSACLDRDLYGTLATQPRARILAPVNLGPAIVLHTPHAVLAGPYHRAGPAILDATSAFSRSATHARGVIAAHDLDMIVTCDLDGTVRATAHAEPESFAAALVRGPLPDWLAAVDATSPIKIYRVRAP